jgi:hypothetical protein
MLIGIYFMLIILCFIHFTDIMLTKFNDILSNQMKPNETKTTYKTIHIISNINILTIFSHPHSHPHYIQLKDYSC